MAEVRLDLEGMTCAACAARIEKKLNRLEGVEATVNFATEQATVRTELPIELATLIGAVESAGYGVRPAGAARAHDHGESPADLRRRLGFPVMHNESGPPVTVPGAPPGSQPAAMGGDGQPRLVFFQHDEVIVHGPAGLA